MPDIDLIYAPKVLLIILSVMAILYISIWWFVKDYDVTGREFKE